MSRVRSPDKMRVSAAILREMHARGWNRRRLADEMGVSPTMVGFWLQGRYTPSLERAARLADLFLAPVILHLTRIASVGSCRVCLRPFTRNATRRAYCSRRCQLDYHKGVSTKGKHPAELAIADYCAGCEPEGICRDDTCPLRAFSPFVFVARHVA